MSCFECDTLEEPGQPFVPINGGQAASEHLRRGSSSSIGRRVGLHLVDDVWPASLDMPAEDGAERDSVVRRDGQLETMTSVLLDTSLKASATCHDILAAGGEQGNVSAVPPQYKKECSPSENVCGVGYPCRDPVNRASGLLPYRVQTMSMLSPQVRRYSFTRIERNGSQWMHFWGLRRYCAKQCEPGCVVMGQRTKIHVCTNCFKRVSITCSKCSLLCSIICSCTTR